MGVRRLGASLCTPACSPSPQPPPRRLCFPLGWCCSLCCWPGWSLSPQALGNSPRAWAQLASVPHTARHPGTCPFSLGHRDAAVPRAATGGQDLGVSNRGVSDLDKVCPHCRATQPCGGVEPPTSGRWSVSSSGWEDVICSWDEWPAVGSGVTLAAPSPSAGSNWESRSTDGPLIVYFFFH